MIGPSDKGLEVTTHPGSNIEEEEESPQSDTHKTKYIHHIFLSANSRKMNLIVISGTAESSYNNGQCHPRSPSLLESHNQQIQYKELKQHERKPIASL